MQYAMARAVTAERQAHIARRGWLQRLRAPAETEARGSTSALEHVLPTRQQRALCPC